jgi:hypothetical protein
MPPIFHGVETAEDKIFWRHYCLHLSNVLTVEGEAKNAFKDIILNLANQHQGLMHSILAVSGKHIDYDTPYGAKLLQDNPATSLEALNHRSEFHHEKAMKRFYEDVARPEDKEDPEYQTILSARYGQMLCMLIGTLADGNPRGEHRVHLQGYKNLIQHSPPEDPTFLSFISEFFQYHIYADELIWHPEMHTRRLASEDWTPSTPIHPPRLLGVADGLFKYLAQITTIRNTIRENMAAGIDPVVNYLNLYRAADIDSAIRAWTPYWPPGDSRDKVCLIYRQMMLLYLLRTVHPPSRSGHQSQVNPPANTRAPQSATTSQPASESGHSSCHSSPEPGPAQASSSSSALISNPASRNPSRTNSTHESINAMPCSPTQLGQRPASPPPIRRPANHDSRITKMVGELLPILESFKPSDPAQTLLLIPCLIIGTSCFDPTEQERIRGAVRSVRGYTGFRNCDRVAQVLEEVWRLMEQGDWVAVWDWQGVARRMGLDFLCT